MWRFKTCTFVYEGQTTFCALKIGIFLAHVLTQMHVVMFDIALVNLTLVGKAIDLEREK